MHDAVQQIFIYTGENVSLDQESTLGMDLINGDGRKDIKNIDR